MGWCGPDPSGPERTDAELAEASSGLPSRYLLKQQLGIGSSRAARLLAELDTGTTPAGDPAHNGAARMNSGR